MADWTYSVSCANKNHHRCLSKECMCGCHSPAAHNADAALREADTNLKSIRQACLKAIREGGAKAADFEFMLGHAEAGIKALSALRSPAPGEAG